MSKIKILLLGMSENIGGIETYYLNLIRNCDYSKFDIYIIDSCKNEMAYLNEFKKFNCHILKITNRADNYFKSLKDLKNIYKKYNFDIIHYSIMTLSWFEPILLAKKYSKAKIILHSHTAGSNKNIKLKTKLLSYIRKFSY